MAISFIAAASTVSAGATAISIARPSGSTDGDLLVAHIFIEDNSDRITTRVPAGWSTVVNQTAGSRAIRQYIHTKILTSTDPSSFTWGMDASDEIVGIISAYRGCDLVTPVGNFAVSTETGASSAATAPQITVTSTLNWVIIAAGNASGSTLASFWTPPTSFTERAEVRSSTGTGNISAALADFIPDTTGATGTKTYNSGSADYFISSLIEIKGFVAEVSLAGVGDIAIVNVGDTFDLSQESSLQVSDSANVQTADTITLSQEQNLVVSDSANANVADSIALEVQTATALTLSLSDYISADAADVTTGQLTAPDGKAVGDDFQAGLISDDTNPLPAIDLASQKYTEVEFCVKLVSGTTGSYDLRITANGSPLGQYLNTPTITAVDVDTLVVSDAYNVNAADTIALEQEEVLSVSEAYNSNVVDQIDLAQESALTVSDAYNSNVADSITLEQGDVLTVSDATNQNIADAISLSQEQNLDVSDGAQINSSDALLLSQEQNIIVSDSYNLNVADSLALLQENVLAVSDAANHNVADAVSLNQEHNLSISDGAQANTSDVLILSQEQNIVVSDSYNANVADSLTLLQENVLTVSDAANVNASAATLLQLHVLGLSDGTQLNVADNITIATEGVDVLAPSDSYVEQYSDALSLSQEQNLSVSDSANINTADVILLVQEYTLQQQDSVVANTADAVTLEQEHTLGLSDSYLANYGDSFDLTTSGVDTLVVSDADNDNVSDTLALVQEHYLAILESYNPQYADDITLTLHATNTLVVSDSDVVNTADLISLSQEHELVIQDAANINVADALVAYQEHVLNNLDSANAQSSDALDLILEIVLGVNGSYVENYADVPRVYTAALGAIIDPYIVSLTRNLSGRSLSRKYFTKSLTKIMELRA